MQDLQALTLMEETDRQKSVDAQVMDAEVPKNNDQVEEQDDTSAPVYEMTQQELQLQEEEEKYDVYLSTFRYEGDNSDLDNKTETESEGHTYPFLDYNQFQRLFAAEDNIYNFKQFS